jgi:hypothetical protein
MAEVGDPTPKGVTLDTSVAHPARVYDYWLGGKDNFAADREAAEQVIAANPTVLRFFDGLEMVEPGVVPLPQWHGPGSEYPIPCYAGMGRKP